MEEEDVGRCKGSKVDGFLWNLSNMSDDASILLTGMISSALLDISMHLFHYLHHHLHLFDRRFRHLWMVGVTSNILGWINRKYVCLTFWKFVLL